MLDALIAGQRNPHELAALARKNVRAKTSVLQEALTGHFTDHHAFMLGMMLARIDALTAQIDTLTSRIGEATAPFAAQVAQLDEIPGIGITAAQDLLAEIGTDMSRFVHPRPPPCPGAKFAPRAFRQSMRPQQSRHHRQDAATPGSAAPCGEATPPSTARTKTFLALNRYKRGIALGGAASNAPWSPSATPSSPSPGTCYPTPPPTSPTSAPTGTTASPRYAANASSSLNSNACPARRSPSTTPPDPTSP